MLIRSLSQRHWKKDCFRGQSYLLPWKNSVLYGVGADTEHVGSQNKAEHLRKLAEISNILVDSSTNPLVTASELTNDDIEILESAID